MFVWISTGAIAPTLEQMQIAQRSDLESYGDAIKESRNVYFWKNNRNLARELQTSMVASNKFLASP